LLLRFKIDKISVTYIIYERYLVNKQKNQSGFSHLIIIVSILALSLVGLLGFVFWQNIIQPKDNNDKEIPKIQPSQPVDTMENKPSDKVSVLVPEIGLSVYLPSDYSVTKGEEDNRFGSFAYYEFDSNSYNGISLSSINLYSEDSVSKFNDTVMSNPNNPLPPEGDYFSLDDVSGILNAYQYCEGFQARDVKYECINLSNGKWLVATHDYSSRKQGYVREYINTIPATSTIIGVKIFMDTNSFD
jgi:hypothetical protein